MRPTLVVLVTMLAFVASLFVVLPQVAPAKQRDAAIGAARLAMVQAAKPVVRKAERTPAPAMTPRVFAVEPVRVSALLVNPPPKTRTPSAPDRTELMVFLN